MEPAGTRKNTTSAQHGDATLARTGFANMEIETINTTSQLAADLGSDDGSSWEDEEQRLVRKIDRRFLPTMWVMYLLAYLDRTNIGNAKIAGMATDLDLGSIRYYVVLVVFFIGYVLCEVPSNMILARTRPSIYLPAIMFCWGCVTIGMAFVPDYPSLIGFRIAMGILEAGFAPGVLLLMSSWYKRREQAKRFAVYISGAILSGAFGGLLAGAITSRLHDTQGIAGWRWLFVVEGAATAGWSIAAHFILPDFPANTTWLTKKERELAISRLQFDDVQDEPTNGPRLDHLSALKVCVRNWRVWLFVIGYMAIVGSSTLSYFYPTLVRGLGYTSTMAQYMTIPIYMAAFVCTAVTAVFADRYSQCRGTILASWMTIAMGCSITVCVVHNFQARYALLVVMASALWSSNALALSYASSTFGSMPCEVRGIALAMVNSLGNLAQIYGAYLFPGSDDPDYLTGFAVVSGLCLTGVVSYFALHILLRKYP